jgi:hypothetical protein
MFIDSPDVVEVVQLTFFVYDAEPSIIGDDTGIDEHFGAGVTVSYHVVSSRVFKAVEHEHGQT